MVVGRLAELAAISTFVAAVRPGAATLILEGEAGIGKTTLWREGVESARAGPWHVLACRAALAESSLAFAALIDLLGANLDEELLASLPAPQARALAFALLLEDAERESVGERTVAVATLNALRALARRQPLLLAIDDLQWLDRPSASVLGYALRRLESEPIAVLASLRMPLDGAAAPRGLERWLADGPVTHLRLGPLSLGALHQLIRERLGLVLPRPLLVRLERASGGNPFYALEVARALQLRGIDEEGGFSVAIPEDLRGLVVQRLKTLPASARAAVLATFALRQATPEGVRSVLRLARLSPRGLAVAIEAGALQAHDGVVELHHPLVGSALYGELNAAQRRTLHGRLARLPLDPEERARHLALSRVGQSAEVAAVLDHAAERAKARGAPEAAAELLELATQLTPAADKELRLQRLDRSAMAHFVAGDSTKAVSLWREIAQAAPPGVLRARAMWRVAEFGSSSLPGGFESVPIVLESVIDEATPDPSLQADIEASLAEFLLWGTGPSAGEAHARAAILLAERGEDRRALAHALVSGALTDFFLGQGTPFAMLERAIAIEADGFDIQTEILPSAFRAYMHGWTCDALPLAAELLDKMLAHALRDHDESSLPFLLWQRCEVALSSGGFDAAAALAARCRDAVEASGRIGRRGGALYCQALVDAYRGRTSEARALARQALELDEPRGVVWTVVHHREVLGLVELSLGRHAQAVEWLMPAHEALRAGGFAEPGAFRFVPDLVESLIALGRHEEARAVLGPYEETARRLGRQSALATAARCRGLLLAASGSPQAGLIALEVAIRLEAELGRPFELARALLARGSVARRAKRRGAADEALRQAGELFERLGAPLWAERANAERARAGFRPAGRTDLTGTERRIAELVAAGHSNPEIAVVLFMSRKTVEAHLTSSYRKLGIHSRAELAARAASLAAPSAGRGEI